MLAGSGKSLATRKNATEAESMLIWADDGQPYGWCRTCRGEGTSTAAMELLLIK